MPKPSRQKGLMALRAVAQGILELIQEPDSDPVEINERVLSLLLLLHPVSRVLRDPARRPKAAERLVEMVMHRWRATEEEWRSLSPAERRSISRGR